MGRILLNHHGEQEWIFQIMEAVRAAVTNGVSRFTSAGVVATNEMPLAVGGSYRFAARSREEILASQREVASAGDVNPRSPFARLQDPAQNLDNVTFQVDDEGNVGEAVPVRAQPRPPSKPVDEGWVL